MRKSEAYFRPVDVELRRAAQAVRSGAGERLRGLAEWATKLSPEQSDEAFLAFVRANPAPYLVPPVGQASSLTCNDWELGAAARRGLRLLWMLAEPRRLSDTDLASLLTALYEHAEYLACFNVTPDTMAKCLNGAFLTLAGCALREFTPATDWRTIGGCRLLSMLEPTRQRLAESGLAAAVRMWRGQLGRGAFRALEDPEYGALLKGVITLVGDWAMADGLSLVPEWAEYYQQLTGKPLDISASLDLHLADDAAFWQSLNLDYPGLERVKAALGRGDQAAAQDAYLDYVARHAALEDRFCLARETPVDLHEMDELSQNIMVLRAHMHVRHDYGKEIDWTTILFDDIESNVSINYHPHMSMLAHAFRQTGNENYLRELVRLLRSWYESQATPNRWQPLLQWRTLEVGNRTGQQWPFVLFVAADQPIFRQGFLWEMCKSYLEHARYLLPHNGGMNNWYQVETTGLGVTALLFPEFKESERFLQFAIRRLEWINRECFLPDGVQSECSTAYHGFPVNGIGIFCEISQLLGQTLTDTFAAEVERMMDLYVYLAQPDLTLPWLNDCSPAILSASGSARLAYKLFPTREDFRYVATQRAEGQPPSATSFAFPYAGYYVMRDGWGADSVYMVFDAGYYGSNHQHEDKLNFEMQAYGRTMIIDPSIYQYKLDEFEPYWRGSRGHNSLMIDGKGQNRRLLAAPEPRPDPDTIWITARDFDFAEGWFKEGFANRTPGRDAREQDLASLDKSLQHQRIVFYVKGEYFIISDRVLGSGTHHLEQIWHLAPIIAAPSAEGVYAGTYATTPTNAVYTTDAGLPNVAILPLSDPRILLRVETGVAEPPVIGWTALYKKCPSHDVTYALDAELPHIMTNVLYPLPAGRSDWPVVKPLTVQAQDPSAVTALRLRQGEYTDTFVLAHGAAQHIRWGEVEFYGRAAWLRQDKAGQIVKAAAVRASLLRVGGRYLLVTPREQENFCL